LVVSFMVDSLHGKLFKASALTILQNNCKNAKLPYFCILSLNVPQLASR